MTNMRYLFGLLISFIDFFLFLTEFLLRTNKNGNNRKKMFNDVVNSEHMAYMCFVL